MRCISYAIAMSLSLGTSFASAEIPAVLTDKIRSGSGIINLLTDVSSGDLATYLQDGSMFLGVDLNESASGNESASSVGVAIQEMELILKTTAGEFSFSEFYTNTTAMIVENGATEAQEFYTLFGNAGGNQLTGSSSGFDISSFDDVIEIKNIDVAGEILSAELRVTFLDTAGTGENETFFDFSAGFEEFALFTDSDATALDSADIGLQEAPQTVSFTDHGDINAAAGAPAPSWFLLGILPAILLYGVRRHG
jgi:hypothetical protein